jgi:hypothetical protein
VAKGALYTTLRFYNACNFHQSTLFVIPTNLMKVLIKTTRFIIMMMRDISNSNFSWFTWTSYGIHVFIPRNLWSMIFRGGIILFNHVGRFHDLGIWQLYSVGPSNKCKIFFYYVYIQVELRNLGGYILPRHYVHELLFIPWIFTKHYSSFIPLLFHKLLSIEALSSKILTMFTIFLLFKLAQFIICTNVNFNMFSKFLPMKVK